jgi:hypothetical protein
MSKRTDPHRPGAIVPANYSYVFSYNGASSDGGWPIPSFGINCELDRRTDVRDKDGKHVSTTNGEHDADGLCCVIGLLHVAKVTVIGNACKCTICGAHFVHGDVWKHNPTGEFIHLGHTCAQKYEMLADRSEFELAAGRHAAAAARECQAAANAEARADFLEKNPGLAAALQVDHYIVKDLASKFQAYHALSEKQVALALKIAHEVANPQAAEKQVPAPTGRVDIEGVVISTKVYQSDFGSTLKMTVKVTTPDGVWLCWGTVPSALGEEKLTYSGSTCCLLKGATVRFTASLKAGREPHFAIFSRPAVAKGTNGVVRYATTEEKPRDVVSSDRWTAQPEKAAVMHIKFDETDEPLCGAYVPKSTVLGLDEFMAGVTNPCSQCCRDHAQRSK